MTIQRMDNVGIVVTDLEAAIAFFGELGMELEGTMPIDGQWAAEIGGFDEVRFEVAMMRTPDGHGKLELMRFHTPEPVDGGSTAPANALGIRRIMFAVNDIDDVLARLRTHGAELVGELGRYEDMFRICYLRGPDGIIIALAEQIG